MNASFDLLLLVLFGVISVSGLNNTIDKYYYKVENGIYLRFLDVNEILHINAKLINDYDPDALYYQRGFFNFDYVVPLYLSNTVYPMKLDLRTSLPYFPDLVGTTGESDLNYFADFSGSANKIAEYDTDGFGESPKSNDHYLSTEEGQFLIDDSVSGIEYSGFFSKDNLYYTHNSLINKVVVGRIKYQNNNYLYKGINGIFGLGPSSFDNAFKDSIFNAIVYQANIDAIFSIGANSYTEGGGFITFGGIDRSLFDGDINWFKYTTYDYYSINIQKISIGNVDIAINLKAVIDTKFENIVVDKYIIEQIKREIQSRLGRGSSKYLNNDGFCSDDQILNIMEGNPVIIDLDSQDTITDLFSPIVLKTDKKNTFIKLTNYIMPGQKLSKYASLNESYYGSIFSSLAESSTEAPMLILGSQFLKHYYIIIDTQRAEIGIAQKSSQECNISYKLERINSNSTIEFLVVNTFTIFGIGIFIFMISGGMEFYDIGELRQSTTTSQPSQSGTVDSRRQEDVKEPIDFQGISNDVMAAIQYTQNDDGTMRVIDNLDELVEELKQESNMKDKLHSD